jgi:hypothetical protein
MLLLQAAVMSTMARDRKPVAARTLKAKMKGRWGGDVDPGFESEDIMTEALNLNFEERKNEFERMSAKALAS